MRDQGEPTAQVAEATEAGEAGMVGGSGFNKSVHAA